ncbi:MAG TPA: hypothetical protein VKG25_25795 [Bryobacteraceae bacterium]|nr:hypothetical protein [Bryobacteraceae bacterium]
MWRYLKAAFWVGVDVPALGRVPVNLAGVLGFGILGFAEPAFWLLGAGLETTFLFAMAFNQRFQKVVDASHLEIRDGDTESKRQNLIRQLPADLQSRMFQLGKGCQRVLEINRQSDDLVGDTNRDALGRLEWVYLKLLVARNNLVSMANQESEADLTKKVAEFEAGLRNTGDSETLRQSRSATLAILKERLANVHRRQESLAEIDSDLTRIEAQVQLIIENASMQGKPQTISSDIELASNLFSSNLFGESQPAIADLDQTYGTKRTEARERAREES